MGGSATNTSKPAVPGQGEGVPSSRRRWEGGDSSRPGRDCAVPSVPTSCLYVQHGLVLRTTWSSCEGVWSWGRGCNCCCQGRYGGFCQGFAEGEGRRGQE